MHGDLLPLFPLRTVLLPRAALPLHVFEERYKDLVRDVMLAGGEFGVVMASEGGLLDIGCTARVERILRQFEDGRMDLIAVGQERFHIASLDSGRSYLRARVDEYEDDDPTPVSEAKLNEALTLHAEYLRASGDESETPGPDEPLLSFVLGAVSPDMGFRRLLLGTRSEARRIEIVAAHLAALIQRRHAEQAMRAKARNNGHSKEWKG